MEDNKNIIVLTHPLSNNYGCILQAYAMQVVLQRMGFNVETDRNGCRIKDNATIAKKGARLLYQFYKQATGHIIESKHNKRIISVNTRAFVDNNINVVDFFEENHISSNAAINKYGTFIVGSDQVWRKGMMDINAYFLPFVCDDGKKKIAYAASFGKDEINDWTKEEIELYSKLLSKFDGVSVRENSGVRICREQLGIEALHVLDPTMLLDKEEYDSLIDKQASSYKDSLFCYVLDKSSEKKTIIDSISNNLRLVPKEIMPKHKIGDKWSRIEDCVFPSVSEWLSGFRDSKFVVTDSFHGTVFSIIFNKPFLAIGNKARGLSRFTSLLHMFGLEDRLISEVDDLNRINDMSIDYTVVNRTIDEWRNKSLSFLKTKLNK